MDAKDRGKRVCAKGSVDKTAKIDWISDLPDSLVCRFLLNLSTKDVVRSSVLSTRWRNLWKSVPGLDLIYEDFPDKETFASFVDRFLGLNSESSLESIKLSYGLGAFRYTDEISHARWINTVLNRKVQHLNLEFPPQAPLTTLYTCESLISLTLCDVFLTKPEFISLPRVKVMDLNSVQFEDESPLDMLISSCPVLESLTLANVEVLRVCSNSLLSFTHGGHVEDDDIDNVLELDAPRLKYLKLFGHGRSCFIIKSSGSLVKADMDIVFHSSFRTSFDPNDVAKKNMIRDFLAAISSVKDMVISSYTIEVINNYSKCEPLLVFPNLAFLRVKLTDYKWEILPNFLERCPNLKSLAVESKWRYLKKKDVIVSDLSGSRCVLSSLEYVNIETPLSWVAMEMKLVRYFLENSIILKKLTLRLDSRNREAFDNFLFHSLNFGGYHEEANTHSIHNKPKRKRDKYIKIRKTATIQFINLIHFLSHIQG